MNPQLKQCLETRGWKVGSVEEFLGLTKEESARIELKLALNKVLKAPEPKNKKRTQRRRVTAKLFFAKSLLLCAFA